MESIASRPARPPERSLCRGVQRMASKGPPVEGGGAGGVERNQGKRWAKQFKLSAPNRYASASIFLQVKRVNEDRYQIDSAELLL